MPRVSLQNAAVPGRNQRDALRYHAGGSRRAGDGCGARLGKPAILLVAFVLPSRLVRRRAPHKQPWRALLGQLQRLEPPRRILSQRSDLQPVRPTQITGGAVRFASLKPLPALAHPVLSPIGLLGLIVGGRLIAVRRSSWRVDRTILSRRRRQESVARHFT